MEHTRGEGSVLAHDCSGTHMAEAVSSPMAAVESQCKGSAWGREGGGNTGQRWGLSCEGYVNPGQRQCLSQRRRWTHRAKGGVLPPSCAPSTKPTPMAPERCVVCGVTKEMMQPCLDHLHVISLPTYMSSLWLRGAPDRYWLRLIARLRPGRLQSVTAAAPMPEPACAVNKAVDGQ